MSRWCFVRHGEATHNVAGHVGGAPTSALTPHGVLQATILGEQLCGTQFTRVLVSPWSRAWDTAQIILARLHPPGPPPEAVDALRERDLGKLRNRPFANLTASEHRMRLSWDSAPPGGESNRDVAVRALSALATVEGSDTVLVVSHAGPLRAVLGVLRGVPEDQIGTLKIPLTMATWADTTAGEIAGHLHKWTTSTAALDATVAEPTGRPPWPPR